MYNTKLNDLVSVSHFGIVLCRKTYFFTSLIVYLQIRVSSYKNGIFTCKNGSCIEFAFKVRKEKMLCKACNK